MRCHQIVLCLTLIVIFTDRARAQVPAAAGAPTAPGAAASAAAPDCLTDMRKAVKYRFDNPGDGDPKARSINDISKRWLDYVCQFTSAQIRPQLLALAEQSRQDKQPGTSSGSSGSTSLVSKGSSPSLIGFAIEHGGLTQSTNGNTVTFRGNLVNSINALINGTYLGSYQLSNKDGFVTALSKLSFGVSFDTTSDQQSSTQNFTPSSSNFSGFSAKYELYNRRDPRHKDWAPKWSELAFTEGQYIAANLTKLDAVIVASPNYDAWKKSVIESVNQLPASPSPDQISQVVQDAADSFHKILWNVPEIQAEIANVTSSMTKFLDKQDQIVGEIRGSWLFTTEYNFTRQLTTNNMMVSATETGQAIPSLSNVNLILEKGITGGATPEFTFNAGATWFNSLDSSNTKRGRVRDYRASAELDIPLKEIKGVGRPVLSFSGQFLSLLNEPLGQKVTINGVSETRTGNIFVFQSKYTIPVKNSGVKIPISFTYASRTELIKEADKRGNIGITFDLDSLFSKAN